MLCPPGMGRMAAMERLLATGNFAEISAEEANREKLAAKTIHKELNEADEANLLEEADMHVFDCKPMSDPLHLVSCNACKKPVKASQYAAHAGLLLKDAFNCAKRAPSCSAWRQNSFIDYHVVGPGEHIFAERCGALVSAEDTGLELDGGAGHKKPPRKGRKKVLVSQDNQAATNFEQERSESFDGDDTAASETANMDEMHTGIVSSLSRDLKRSSPSIDGALVGDGSGVSPGSTNHSGGVISPLKRARAPSESMPSSDGLETHCGVSAETGPCCQGAHTCKMHSDSSKRSAVGVKQPYDAALGRQKPRQDLEHEPAAKADHLSDGPVPLATKVYHLQRNHQLRAALGHLYRETIAKEHTSDSVSPRLLRSNGIPSPQVSSPSNFFSETLEGLNQKKVVRKPDQILAQSSELCLGVSSGGYPSMMNVPNQFRDNNFARPSLPVDNGSMGMMRKSYIPPPYTFPVNPGATLGNMQQPNGIMPVV